MGIARAKAEGRYKGRPPSIDRAKVRELLTRMGPADAAKTLGVAACARRLPRPAYGAAPRRNAVRLR